MVPYCYELIPDSSTFFSIQTSFYHLIECTSTSPSYATFSFLFANTSFGMPTSFFSLSLFKLLQYVVACPNLLWKSQYWFESHGYLLVHLPSDSFFHVGIEHCTCLVDKVHNYYTSHSLFGCFFVAFHNGWPKLDVGSMEHIFVQAQTTLSFLSASSPFSYLTALGTC